MARENPPIRLSEFFRPHLSTKPAASQYQWLIIQGRFADAPFIVTRSATRPAPGRTPLLQHPQEAGCAFDRVGAWALRSFVALACRTAPSIAANAGAVSIARGAALPHPSQECGSLNSAMGRTAVNGPHALHK